MAFNWKSKNIKKGPKASNSFPLLHDQSQVVPSQAIIWIKYFKKTNLCGTLAQTQALDMLGKHSAIDEHSHINAYGLKNLEVCGLAQRLGTLLLQRSWIQILVPMRQLIAVCSSVPGGLMHLRGHQVHIHNIQARNS